MRTITTELPCCGVEVVRCSGCGVSLGGRDSVTRLYTGRSFDIQRDIVHVSGLGHYTSEGDFEPDGSVSLPDGAQTFDGDDCCTQCGHVVG